MSDTLPYILNHIVARQRAAKACMRAPDGYVVTIKPPTRSLVSNAKLHATLTDISKQVKWAGETLDVEDWKRLFVAHLHGQKIIPALEGGGFVVLNKLTRRMSNAQTSEVIELALSFGTERGVRFSAPEMVA